MTVTFVVTADGSVSVTKQQPEQDPPSRESLLPEITEKLKDPNYSISEINRLVCGEFALLAQEMTIYGRHNSTASMSRSWRGQLTYLTGLQKSLQNTQAMSRKEVLNFDGPKFKFFFGRVTKLFREAAEQALGKDSDTSVQSIMRHFRDLVGVNDENLRRETERFGAEGAPQ